MKSSKTQSSAAFSLVEVTLAIGILSFAFVAVFGMLPVGLQTFRDSSDKTVTTRIAQQLLAEVQQTPFNNISGMVGPLHYFDATGAKLGSATSPSVSGLDGYVYSAIIQDAPSSALDHNESVTGLSPDRTRMILIKITKNKLADALPQDEKPLAQFAFAIADMQL